MRLARLGIVGALLLAVCIGAASAAQPPGWQAVGSADVNAELGVARTGDGVLHVAFATSRAAGQSSLVQIPISASGRVGNTSTIVSNWQSLNPSVALLSQPDGSLRAFYAGLDSTTAPGPTFAKLATSTSTSTSTSAGSAWSEPVLANAGSSFVAQAAGIGAGTANDGTPVEAWGDSGPGYNRYHFGVDSSEADVRFEADCCAYGPQIATDAKTGQVMLGWFSTSKQHGGIEAQVIAPSAAGGRLLVAPASATIPLMQPTAITGRLGAPGIFVAYGSGTAGDPTKLELWRVGTRAPRVLAKAPYVSNVALGAMPAGRLWILWEAAGLFHAACTNAQATKIGPITSFARPGHLASVSRAFGLQGDAYKGRLDVFALAGPGNPVPGTTTIWHTRVRLSC
jgi:hypothetical protein